MEMIGIIDLMKNPSCATTLKENADEIGISELKDDLEY